MGILIQDDYKIDTLGLTLTNLHCTIKGTFSLQKTKSYSGETRYILNTTVHLFADLSKQSLYNFLHSIEINYSQTSGDLPLLIYNDLKQNKFSGLTCIDE